MKIDLHCHTIKVKTGEPATRNVTSKVFAQKVRNADVKIVAITNHNLFDITQYRQFAKEVGEDCQVWPGVELNINGSNGKQWHLIVVSNPDTVEDFNSKLNDLVDGKTPEKCFLDLEAVTQAFALLECFYLPHYHKSPKISEEDSKRLLELVGDSFKILNETSDIRSMGVFTNHDQRVVVGSDVRDWSKYEASTFSELRLPVESFHQLYMLIRRDKQVVNTLLNKNDSRTLKLTILNSIKLNLNLFNEVNVIFGSKGTGKTEILKAIQETLERQGYSCSSYFGSEKETQFNQLLTTESMTRYVGKVNSVSCEDQFLAIKNWIDKSPTPLQEYTQWTKTKDTSANKQRMKITSANTPLEPSDSKYLEVKKDSSDIGKIVKILGRIDTTRYLSKSRYELLEQLIQELESSIQKDFRKELIDINAANLSKWSIERIKQLADKKSNTRSRPGATGFSAFAINRLKLYESTRTILHNITNREWREKELIGNLEGKGNVYIQAVYRMCCEESERGEFGERKVTNIKKIVALIKQVEKEFYKVDVYHLVSSLIEEFDSSSVNSTEQFLGLSKQVVLGDGEKYKPSNGEKAILIMQKVLGENKDAYIFDEPELGMGNSYIDKDIRPKISGLGKSNKMVIIATHNANIAVRTLPYTTIYRDHDNGVYNTYVGNAFTNSLANITDPADVINWKDTSMNILEGGVEAFYDRKDIYESRNN